MLIKDLLPQARDLPEGPIRTALITFLETSRDTSLNEDPSANLFNFVDSYIKDNPDNALEARNTLNEAPAAELLVNWSTADYDQTETLFSRKIWLLPQEDRLLLDGKIYSIREITLLVQCGANLRLTPSLMQDEIEIERAFSPGAAAFLQTFPQIQAAIKYTLQASHTKSYIPPAAAILPKQTPAIHGLIAEFLRPQDLLSLRLANRALHYQATKALFTCQSHPHLADYSQKLMQYWYRRPAEPRLLTSFTRPEHGPWWLNRFETWAFTSVDTPCKQVTQIFSTALVLKQRGLALGNIEYFWTTLSRYLDRLITTSETTPTDPPINIIHLAFKHLGLLLPQLSDKQVAWIKQNIRETCKLIQFFENFTEEQVIDIASTLITKTFYGGYSDIKKSLAHLATQVIQIKPDSFDKTMAVLASTTTEAQPLQYELAWHFIFKSAAHFAPEQRQILIAEAKKQARLKSPTRSQEYAYIALGALIQTSETPCIADTAAMVEIFTQENEDFTQKALQGLSLALTQCRSEWKSKPMTWAVEIIAKFKTFKVRNLLDEYHLPNLDTLILLAPIYKGTELQEVIDLVEIWIGRSNQVNLSGNRSLENIYADLCSLLPAHQLLYKLQQVSQFPSVIEAGRLPRPDPYDIFLLMLNKFRRFPDGFHTTLLTYFESEPNQTQLGEIQNFVLHAMLRIPHEQVDDLISTLPIAFFSPIAEQLFRLGASSPSSNLSYIIANHAAILLPGINAVASRYHRDNRNQVHIPSYNSRRGAQPQNIRRAEGQLANLRISLLIAIFVKDTLLYDIAQSKTYGYLDITPAQMERCHSEAVMIKEVHSVIPQPPRILDDLLELAYALKTNTLSRRSTHSPNRQATENSADGGGGYGDVAAAGGGGGSKPSHEIIDVTHTTKVKGKIVDIDQAFKNPNPKRKQADLRWIVTNIISQLCTRKFRDPAVPELIKNLHYILGRSNPTELKRYTVPAETPDSTGKFTVQFLLQAHGEPEVTDAEDNGAAAGVLP